MHFYIPAIVRSSLFLILLIFSVAIVYITDRNIQTVRILAIQSLTDTAVGLSSATENALRSMNKNTSSEIRSILSDRIVAYALVAGKDRTILYHTNSGLIGTKLPAREIDSWISAGTVTNRRIMLGTGVPAYEFNFVMHRPDGLSEMLRLVLHTTRADKMISQAEGMWWITASLLVLLWMSGILFERFFTHRIKIQEEKENQKRLTIIGQMTAVLAHEIRNALGSIKGYTQWLGEKTKEPGPQKEALSAILKGIMRIEKLVSDLLLFSRRETYNAEMIELPELIGEALAATAKNWTGVTKCNIDPEAMVIADREKLLRVLVNVIKNAMEAMEPDGHLRIDVHQSGQAVAMRIEDTGKGISEKEKHNLFTPFYTTKTDGTGLGLAYSKKLTEGMGGSITLINKKDTSGSVLTILLPKGRKS